MLKKRAADSKNLKWLQMISNDHQPQTCNEMNEYETNWHNMTQRDTTWNNNEQHNDNNNNIQQQHNNMHKQYQTMEAIV